MTIGFRTVRAAFFLSLAFAIAAGTKPGAADEFRLQSFGRQQLTDTYFSEGANAGDLNRDGHPDVVYGPYWFEGPSFEKKHEIYAPKPQPTERYADNFFNWIYDFNGDGLNDVFRSIKCSTRLRTSPRISRTLSATSGQNLFARSAAHSVTPRSTGRSHLKNGNFTLSLMPLRRSNLDTVWVSAT
jgi:hypothetical protein